MFMLGFPLLLVPFAIYNIIAFLMPGVSWNAPLTHVPLKSGADWSMSVGDILGYLAGGMSGAQILADFPQLTADDVRACLAYAAERERRTVTTPAA